jgi:uncharacterized protein (DUF1015 family)
MAEVVPFRALLYDQQRAGPLDALIAPPYDVVSEKDRAALAAKSPFNIVRVDLPDGDPGQKYENAARELRRWVDEGALRRDPAPAFYRYHQVFTLDGREHTRRGFVSRIRLRRFAEGVVLPHERTLSGPRLDRLALSRACRTNLSQVFALYSDPGGAIDAEFSDVESPAPEMEGRLGDGVVHRIWRLTDHAAQARIASALADKRVYIADGHHRYETMLAIRDELRPQASSPRSSIEYGSMFLTSMDDPGLSILPTHRVVHGLREFDLSRFLERLKGRFEVRELAAADAAGLRGPPEQREGSYLLASRGRFFSLSLRPGEDNWAPGPGPLRRLDVPILHTLILEQMLGIDRSAQERQTNLRYVKDSKAALEESRRADVQAVFLLNPTRIEQLKAVADAGEVMPQKSTFFYPKLASGLLLDPIDPREEAEAP